MVEFFEWPLAQNLAYRIVVGLDGFSRLVEDKSQREIMITGDLSLADEEFKTKKMAFCSFRVDSRWIQRIPEVICIEPWVTRKSPEWHADEQGRLCFEFSSNWERELPAMVERYTHGLTADYAAKWLLNSTRSLLNRHLFAYRNEIKKWPKSWDFWPHSRVEAERRLFQNEPTQNSDA